MQIIITSCPDREKVFAELYAGDDQWAELSQEEDALVLELYPREDAKPWTFQYAEVIEILQRAEHALLGAPAG
jgi:hypothetical protein